MDSEKKLRAKTGELTKQVLSGFLAFLHDNGLDYETASETARQTVLGSGIMMKNSEIHPAKLIDMVCSPGGTTIEGLMSLEKNGFNAYIIEQTEV